MNVSALEHLDAVTRRVTDTTRDDVPVHRIALSRVFDAPTDRVWAAVSDPEEIPRWFLPVSGDLRTGGTYQLDGNAGGRILVCEPPRSYSITWEFDGSLSWVDVGVVDEAGGARLDLIHDAPVAGDEHWRAFGAGAGGIGWEMGWIGLATYLATGQAVDPEEFAAWAGSADGLSFVPGSSAAWERAEVASGVDPETARARAATCLSAYTAPPPEA